MPLNSSREISLNPHSTYFYIKNYDINFPKYDNKTIWYFRAKIYMPDFCCFPRLYDQIHFTITLFTSVMDGTMTHFRAYRKQQLSMFHILYNHCTCRYLQIVFPNKQSYAIQHKNYKHNKRKSKCVQSFSI